MVGNDPINETDYLGFGAARTPAPPILRRDVTWDSINFDVAKEHYRTGGGGTVILAFSLVEIDFLQARDFKAISDEIFNATHAGRGMRKVCAKKTFDYPEPGGTKAVYRPTGTGDAEKVLGDITVKFIGKLNIECDCSWKVEGKLRAFNDNYGFELDAKRDPIRNLKTAYAGAIHGSGMPYDIAMPGEQKFERKSP